MKVIVLSMLFFSSQVFAWEQHHWATFNELTSKPRKQQQYIDPYQQQLDRQRAILEMEMQNQIQDERIMIENKMRHEQKTQRLMDGWKQMQRDIDR